MKKIIDYLKTIAMGGFFVLFPLLLFYLLLAEILQLIVSLATPIADILFPQGAFDGTNLPVVVAIFLIFVVSLMLGIALQSDIGRRLGQWIEGKTIGRLSLYKAVKHLAGGLAGNESFQPALLKHSETEREIVYIIEEHGNGQITILVPRAPTSFTGPVKIVSKNRIEILNANLGDVSRILSQWGVGVRDLLGEGR
jgi:uncharacterized membrane protein